MKVSKKLDYISITGFAVEVKQVTAGERLHGMQEVLGSIPIVSTNNLNQNGRNVVFF
jgi:hypothetical protein